MKFRCKHKYKKVYSKERKGYVSKCVKCGKEVAYPYIGEKAPLWCRIKREIFGKRPSCDHCVLGQYRCKKCSNCEEYINTGFSRQVQQLIQHYGRSNDIEK